MDTTKFLISCGNKKSPIPIEAIDMYTGSYFLAIKEYLYRIGVNREDIYILSAKYGIIHANDIITPYNVKFGTKNPDIISVENISKQVDKYNMNNFNKLYFIGGTEYKKILNQTKLNYIDFLEERVYNNIVGKGMGYQISWFKKNGFVNLLDV